MPRPSTLSNQPCRTAGSNARRAASRGPTRSACRPHASPVARRSVVRSADALSCASFAQRSVDVATLLCTCAITRLLRLGTCSSFSVLLGERLLSSTQSCRSTCRVSVRGARWVGEPRRTTSAAVNAPCSALAPPTVLRRPPHRWPCRAAAASSAAAAPTAHVRALRRPLPPRRGCAGVEATRASFCHSRPHTRGLAYLSRRCCSARAPTPPAAHCGAPPRGLPTSSSGRCGRWCWK